MRGSGKAIGYDFGRKMILINSSNSAEAAVPIPYICKFNNPTFLVLNVLVIEGFNYTAEDYIGFLC